jgi:hypothetical protein
VPDLSLHFLNENIFENPQTAYGHFAISEDGCLGVVNSHRKLDNHLVFLGTKVDTSPGEGDLWVSILPKVLDFVVSPDRVAGLAEDLAPEPEEGMLPHLAMLPHGFAQLLLARQQEEDRLYGGSTRNKPPIPGMLPLTHAPEGDEELPLSLTLKLSPDGQADIEFQSTIPEEELTEELKEFIQYVTNWVQQMNARGIDDDAPDIDDIIGPPGMG